MPDRLPNVLFVICDDLAFGDLSCHGNPHVRTPHLDRLHAQGTRLTRYGSGPLCTPARASVMSGRYPYRTGAVDTYLGRSMMHGDEVTLAEVLRDAGYATCLSGKWHLGDCYPMRPEDQGFDETLYHLGGGLSQPANHDWPNSNYFDPLLMHKGQPQRRKGYCTDVFTDHALSFIDAQRERPWFCYLAFNAPHCPFRVDEAMAQPFLDAGLPEKWARLYAMVENIDANVGRAMAKLDELGLSDDTIVVFTSDHGPCPTATVDGQIRFNAGLRGIKGDMYEGGLRVPCLVRYPKRIGAGVDVDRIANPIDWLPTFASLCAAQVPTDRTIDGVDLTPLLVGEADSGSWPDRKIFAQWHRGDVPQRGNNCCVITQRYKWCKPGVRLVEEVVAEPVDELYDLELDPGETTNLAPSMPDCCAAMRADYGAWFDDVSSTRGTTPQENYAPPRIVVGSDAARQVVLSRQDWRSQHPMYARPQVPPGHWLLDVVAPGPYDITVDLPSSESGQELETELELACGPLSLRSALTSMQVTARFENVNLPTGVQRLDCSCRRSDRHDGVWFVKIEQRVGTV